MGCPHNFYHFFSEVKAYTRYICKLIITLEFMKKIACLKHPTTVICIDDDYRFIDTLKISFETSDILCKTFDKHQLAIPYINADRYRQEFTQKLNDIQNDDEASESLLYLFVQELMNQERYNQISVVVVDYDMPGMNGLELCAALANPFVKIIMLTGAADETLAVRAFNQGLIHQYVRKQDHHFVEQLIEAVVKAQQNYFAEISTLPLKLFKNGFYHTAMSDPAFQDYFYNILTTHRIKEYYLAEATGSFIMIDDKQKIHSLITLNDQLIETILTIYDVDIMTDNQIEAIEQRKLIPCYYNAFNKVHYMPDNLNNFLHKPIIIQGQQHKFYTVFGEGLIPVNNAQFIKKTM